MSEKSDYIQLPPIRRDTPTEVVSMIWEYLKLPEEFREKVEEEMEHIHNNCDAPDFQISDLHTIVPKEEIAGFEATMRKIIADIISESSGIACWVYVEKYIHHKTLDEMLEEWEGDDKFIVVMDTLFEKYLAG